MRLLLIDGNNLLISSWHVMQDLQNSKGQRVGGVYGALSRLKWVIREFHDYMAVVVWDGMRSARRMKLHPGYKAGRPTMEDEDRAALDQNFAWAKALFDAMGIIQFQFEEADDVISVLARSATNAVIYSSDKDFFQLVSPTTMVRRHSLNEDGEAITVSVGSFENECLRSFKVPYQSGQVVRLIYGLVGDPGDNIQGIKGVGHKTAFEIVNSLRAPVWRYIADKTKRVRHDSTWVKLLEEVRSICAKSNKKVWNRVDDQWEQFIVAHKLTDLWRPCLLPQHVISELADTVFESTKVFNHQQVMSFLVELEFEEERQYFTHLEATMTQRQTYTTPNQLW